MRQLTLISVVVLLCIARSPAVVDAWSIEGHWIIVRMASQLLPDEWAGFFLYHKPLLEQATAYPDTIYRESDRGEDSRHYIEVGFWDPSKPWTGTLPQAVEEFTLRMQSDIRARLWNQMFLDAGRLAHYMADAAQPYHVTRNYNPITRDGVGVHGLIDASVAVHSYEFRFVTRKDIGPVNPVQNITKFVLDTAAESHFFLGTTNRTLIEEGQSWSPELTKIIENRTNAAIVAVARIWYTAISSAETSPPLHVLNLLQGNPIQAEVFIASLLLLEVAMIFRSKARSIFRSIRTLRGRAAQNISEAA